jgi:predicted dehydrogenase
MSDRPPLGIGIIGAGAMARTYCECLTKHTAGARLIAVSGGTRAPALAADYRVTACATVEDMLARPDLGAVIIATPEMRHLEQTLLAAAQGKHVLVEKPEAKEVAPCDAMVARCAEVGVTLAVCHHWRFRSVHTRALALVRGGRLGAVRSVTNHTLVSHESSVAGFASRPFYLDPECGGLLMGWAIHNFDWVRCLAGGDPTSVSAVTTPAGAWGEGTMVSQIAFANGVAGTVDVDITRPGSARYYFKTEITTERAKLELDGYGELRVDDGSGWKTLWTQPAFNPKDDTCPLRLEGYSLMVQAFIDQAKGTQTPSPPDQVRSLASGRDGRMAVALFQASLASGAAGRPVPITG